MRKRKNLGVFIRKVIMGNEKELSSFVSAKELLNDELGSKLYIYANSLRSMS